MMRLGRVPRLLVRLACFLLAVALLWPVHMWPNASEIAIQASPFVAVCAIIAGRTLNAGLLLGLGIAGIVLFRKRWFCRYICPTGLLQDWTSTIGLHKTRWWFRCPSIGRYILLLTAAGAIVGYPLLLWMDPLAFFSSALSVHKSTSVSSGVLSVLGLAVLLSIALTSGNLWCTRLCPLGAMQDLLADLKSLFEKNRKNQQDPSVENNLKGSAVPATRRAFMAVAAGVGLGLWARRIGGARAGNSPLRPPGAVAEDVFTGLCVRCGNCIRSCPSKILHSDAGHAGLAGFLAPTVHYEKEYCLEDCNACTKVCPSGALKNLVLERKRKYVIGEALVDGSLCFLVRGVNDCNICVRSCPFDAVQIYWDEDLYVAYPVVDPEKCNGCGACEVYCPTGDVKAIRVWKSA